MTLREMLLRPVSRLPRQGKRWLMALADMAALAAALYLAFALPAGSAVPEALAGGRWLLLALPLATLPLFLWAGLYRMIVRYMGPRVAVAVIRGVTASTALLALAMWTVPGLELQFAVLFIYWVVALQLVGGMRLAVRTYLQSLSQRGAQPKPVIIYGAGRAGAQSAASLLQGTEYRPVAFVDDDRSLQGSELHGIRVHAPADIMHIARVTGARLVLLAMPSVSHQRRRTIIERLEPLPLTVKTLPGLPDLLSGAAQLDEFRDVDVDDLLGRDPVAPDRELLEYCVRGKVVLVTGAGGSIGSELSRQILRLGPTELLLLDSSEYALYEIHRELERVCEREGLSVKLHPLLGSVLDQLLLRRIMTTCAVDSVYHAAAYKHVPMVERNVVEGVRNNVLGTWRCAMAALESGVSSFVLISTDKAVRPSNIMGASKRMAELVLQALATQTTDTRFIMVRFGNVLGSSGSVVPLFREQIARGGPVTVTDPRVVRYFMTMTEAAELVLQAGSMGQGGDVFVLNTGQPVKILNLARRMIHLLGFEVRDERNPDGDIDIIFTGLRPGEKLREELLIGDSASGTRHPMIVRAEESSLPWPRLLECLHDLEAACERFDCQQVRSLLQAAVQEYQAEEQILDPMWQHGATPEPGESERVRRLH